MTQPGHHLSHAMRLCPGRDVGPINHNDRQAKRPRCRDLGISSGAARVFRNHEINTVLLNEFSVVRFRKRSARHQHMVIGKRWGAFGCVHKAQQIKMLGVRGKVAQMHATNSQHHPTRRDIKRRGSTSDIGHAGPIVPGLLDPRGAGQRNQRYLRLRTGKGGVAAHLRRKWVGGVNYMCDFFGLQIIGQPVDTTKAADTLAQGLAFGTFDATCKTYDALQFVSGRGVGKGSRFGGPTKDQEVGAHV